MSSLAIGGSRSVVVEIGGTPICFSADSTSFLALAKERYLGFLPSVSQAPLNVTVNVVPRSDSGQEDIRVRLRPEVWSAERADFKLDWDPKSNSGSLQLELNTYSLDAALRVLHTLLLAEEAGFLLHAASAVRGRRAFLFFGPSGSGKTTISRLAPPDATLLTDEISYVRRVGANFVAYGTPFTGELAKSGENIRAPIAALYHLVKAPANRLIPMNPHDAARALLGSILFFAQDAQLVNLVFHSVCDLVGQLPVYRLEFVADQSVWELVQ